MVLTVESYLLLKPEYVRAISKALPAERAPMLYFLGHCTAGCLSELHAPLWLLAISHCRGLGVRCCKTPNQGPSAMSLRIKVTGYDRDRVGTELRPV